MGLCRELRKGNSFSYLYLFTNTDSKHLECTQYPAFLILRSPWLYRTCWSWYRKSQRLEISLRDRSFLPLLQRKRKESHCWSAVTRGPRIAVGFLQEHLLQAPGTGLSTARPQSGTQHSALRARCWAGIRARPELRCTGSNPCISHAHTTNTKNGAGSHQ